MNTLLNYNGSKWGVAAEIAASAYRKQPSIKHADALIDAIYKTGRKT